MQITVQYIGIYRDCAGVRGEDLILPAMSDVEDLVQVLVERHPDLSAFASQMRVLRNGQGVGRSEALRDGDEIVLVDPISGGSTSDV